LFSDKKVRPSGSDRQWDAVESVSEKDRQRDMGYAPKELLNLTKE
jgi:hypothetical protein